MKEFWKYSERAFGVTIGVAVGIWAIIIWHVLMFIIYDLTH